MDNTTQKNALAQPNALDPRSKKSTQANTRHTAILALKTAVYDLLRLFFVLSTTVLYLQQTPKKSPPQSAHNTKSGEQ